ncbi:hypothetical protein RJ639_015088 [Escallonia herrerae]|uniref:Uncharacterized protein n=1 Tax=Escallonia herrerae TaxID=1293975 RepID=A0AA88VGY0_9ASTE|nr:hypothetical protein RJ639_015088 [Escallonia herrerae]
MPQRNSRNSSYPRKEPSSDKALASTLTKRLLRKRHDNSKGAQVEMTFLLHFILDSLHVEYDLLKFPTTLMKLNGQWINLSALIHVDNIMQGFLSLRQPIDSEQDIYLRNRMSSHIEAVGTFRLVLQNLIFVSKLVSSGFGFNFVGQDFHLLKNSSVVVSLSLVDGL